MDWTHATFVNCNFQLQMTSEEMHWALIGRHLVELQLELLQAITPVMDLQTAPHGLLAPCHTTANSNAQISAHVMPRLVDFTVWSPGALSILWCLVQPLSASRPSLLDLFVGRFLGTSAHSGCDHTVL